MTDMEGMDPGADAQGGPNYGGFVLNFLTAVMLLATVGVAGIYAAVLINPFTPLNPQPPPTLPPTLGPPTTMMPADISQTEKGSATSTHTEVAQAGAILPADPPTEAQAVDQGTPEPTPSPGVAPPTEAPAADQGTLEGTPSPSVSPPTKTPTPTPGITDATSTPALGPSNSVPNPDDPDCVDHNDRVWHALHDPVSDCHYDHAHGMPEADWVRPVFGDRIADFVWTVSYPWQTPNENLRKHAGYAMHVYDFRAETCYGVDAYAAQTHGVAIEEGKLSRLHSFALAASLCDPDDGSDAGIIFTAGWEDYGQLISPYKQNFVSYPKFPEQKYDIGLPPYVGEMNPASGSQVETWNSASPAVTSSHVEKHGVATIAFRIRNAVDFIDPDTRLTGNPVFITVDEPENNSSAYQLYQIQIDVPDLNGDGSPVTGEFRTDRHGKLVDCSVLGTDCVPLILIEAVPGNYSLNATAVGLIESTHRPGSFFDHDIWFCGDAACPPHSLGAVPSGWIDLSSFGK